MLLALTLAIGWLFYGAPAPSTALDVDVVGFRYRTADGAYVFDADAPPRLLVPAGAVPGVAWSTAGQTSTATLRTAALPGELRVEITGWDTPPAPGAGTLVVTRSAQIARRPARWSERSADIAAIRRLTEARTTDAASFERAWSRLDRTDPAIDLWAGVELARAMQSRDDPDRAIAAWLEAADDARRLGAITEVARRCRAAAYIAWRHRRTAEMEQLLARADGLFDADFDPGGHARLRYMQGLSGRLIGDWNAARRALDTAVADFERLGDETAHRAALETLALLLADLGRNDDALAALERIAEARISDPDARARYALNLGWLTLRALPENPIAAQKTELRQRLDAAREAARASQDRLRTANAAVNQAWGALKLGDLDAAETRLEEARLLDPEGEGYAAPYATLLQARADLARGRLDAAEVGFRRLEARARAEQGAVSELRWRALFGLGRVARARPDLDAARAHFDQALAVVDALGRRAALRGDRATFHADRAELVDEAIDLTAEPEPWRAFGYADAARARPMRALQADVRVGALDPATRRRWAEALDMARAAAEAAREAHGRLAVAPLAEEAARRREAEAADTAREAAFDAAFAILDTATPTPGGIDGQTLSGLLAADEVLFGFHGRWAFRVDRQGTRARRSAIDDPLGDWRALPGAVRHVYIVPGGHPEAFRLATAGERPLLEQVSVSFVPYAGLLARPAAASAERRPLVVADPRRDLSHAAAEGRAVAEALDGARLLGGAEASRDAVLPALARAEPFHFAGHGVLHPERPWDAHLRLAGSDTLSLSDVLTHPMGPSLVVLSGCETGVDAVLLDEAVVGLPEAFLAAGAQAVLATDRQVDDRATRRFMDRFYAADGARAPASALRTAALQARAEGDRAWSAFRLVGDRGPAR